VQRLPELLHTCFTDLRFISLDLSLMPTDDILGIPFLTILFRTFKHIRGPELLKIAEESIVLLKDMGLDPDALEFFNAYVTYLETAAPKDKIEEIRKMIEKVFMKDDGAMSELLRKIYGDLYRKSIENAEEKKDREVEKYKQEAEKMKKKNEEIVKNMILAKIDETTIAHITGLSIDTIRKMRGSTH
jgi:hypothetical protein